MYGKASLFDEMKIRPTFQELQQKPYGVRMIFQLSTAKSGEIVTVPENIDFQNFFKPFKKRYAIAILRRKLDIFGILSNSPFKR